MRLASLGPSRRCTPVSRLYKSRTPLLTELDTTGNAIVCVIILVQFSLFSLFDDYSDIADSSLFSVDNYFGSRFFGYPMSNLSDLGARF